jgi:hypothetical protein
MPRSLANAGTDATMAETAARLFSNKHITGNFEIHGSKPP